VSSSRRPPPAHAIRAALASSCEIVFRNGPGFVVWCNRRRVGLPLLRDCGVPGVGISWMEQFAGPEGALSRRSAVLALSFNGTRSLLRPGCLDFLVGGQSAKRQALSVTLRGGASRHSGEKVIVGQATH